MNGTSVDYFMLDKIFGHLNFRHFCPTLFSVSSRDAVELTAHSLKCASILYEIVLEF